MQSNSSSSSNTDTSSSFSSSASASASSSSVSALSPALTIPPPTLSASNSFNDTAAALANVAASATSLPPLPLVNISTSNSSLSSSSRHGVFYDVSEVKATPSTPSHPPRVYADTDDSARVTSLSMSTLNMRHDQSQRSSTGKGNEHTDEKILANGTAAQLPSPSGSAAPNASPVATAEDDNQPIVLDVSRPLLPANSSPVRRLSTLQQPASSSPQPRTISPSTPSQIIFRPSPQVEEKTGRLGEEDGTEDDEEDDNDLVTTTGYHNEEDDDEASLLSNHSFGTTRSVKAVSPETAFPVHSSSLIDALLSSPIGPNYSGRPLWLCLPSSLSHGDCLRLARAWGIDPTILLDYGLRKRGANEVDMREMSILLPKGAAFMSFRFMYRSPDRGEEDHSCATGLRLMVFNRCVVSVQSHRLPLIHHLHHRLRLREFYRQTEHGAGAEQDKDKDKDGAKDKDKEREKQKEKEQSKENRSKEKTGGKREVVSEAEPSIMPSSLEITFESDSDSEDSDTESTSPNNSLLQRVASVGASAAAKRERRRETKTGGITSNNDRETDVKTPRSLLGEYPELPQALEEHVAFMDSCKALIFSLLRLSLDSCLKWLKMSSIELKAVEDLIFDLSASEHRDLIRRITVGRRKLIALRAFLETKQMMVRQLLEEPWASAPLFRDSEEREKERAFRHLRKMSAAEADAAKPLKKKEKKPASRSGGKEREKEDTTAKKTQSDVASASGSNGRAARHSGSGVMSKVPQSPLPPPPILATVNTNNKLSPTDGDIGISTQYVTQSAQFFLRGFSDSLGVHLTRISSHLDLVGFMQSNYQMLMAEQANQTSTRTNEGMKRMSVVAFASTPFMLLSGFMGMNVQVPFELDHQDLWYDSTYLYPFFGVLGVALTISLISLTYLKSRRII